MNNDELTETVNSIYQLCMAQAGKIAALETITNAITASIGLSLPPLAQQIQTHTDGLARFHRENLEPLSVEVFNTTITEFQSNMDKLAGNS